MLFSYLIRASADALRPARLAFHSPLVHQAFVMPEDWFAQLVSVRLLRFPAVTGSATLDQLSALKINVHSRRFPAVTGSATLDQLCALKINALSRRFPAVTGSATLDQLCALKINVSPRVVVTQKGALQ